MSNTNPVMLLNTDTVELLKSLDEAKLRIVNAFVVELVSSGDESQDSAEDWIIKHNEKYGVEPNLFDGT